MSSQPKRSEPNPPATSVGTGGPAGQHPDIWTEPVPSDNDAERRQRNIERNQAAIALIESWRTADAALTPEEQRRAQEEWEALQRDDYPLAL